MSHACTEKRFMDDVKKHQMTIIRDDGVNRHIRLKVPGSTYYHFDLITWPGHLCITGGCGTYVFRRIEDMFCFFRDDEEYNKKHGRQIGINPNYWMEKVLAADRCNGCMEFSEDSFRDCVKHHFDMHVESNPDDKKANKLLWSEIKEDVLYYADNEHEAYQAVSGFEHEGFIFQDFFDGGGTEEYTFRYIWNLYAIVWGISKYDTSKAMKAAA
jgi:hypothetical protein